LKHDKQVKNLWHHFSTKYMISATFRVPVDRMPRFAANLTWLFTEYSFLDRFDAAADCRFDAVEVVFPYDYPAAAIARCLGRTRLTMALINTPPGNIAGDRGLATPADRANDFLESIARAAHYAETTDARRVHVMAGMADMEDARAQATYRDSIAFAADYFASRQIEAVVELINGRDIPRYFSKISILRSD
jgi:hydroxypyruvate isomerase